MLIRLPVFQVKFYCYGNRCNVQKRILSVQADSWQRLEGCANGHLVSLESLHAEERFRRKHHNSSCRTGPSPGRAATRAHQRCHHTPKWFLAVKTKPQRLPTWQRLANYWSNQGICHRGDGSGPAGAAHRARRQLLSHPLQSCTKCRSPSSPHSAPPWLR